MAFRTPCIIDPRGPGLSNVETDRNPTLPPRATCRDIGLKRLAITITPFRPSGTKPRSGWLMALPARFSAVPSGKYPGLIRFLEKSLGFRGSFWGLGFGDATPCCVHRSNAATEGLAFINGPVLALSDRWLTYTACRLSSKTTSRSQLPDCPVSYGH